MIRKHACMALLAAAAVAAGTGAHATRLPRPQPLTRQGYEAQKTQIDAQYQADRKLCAATRGKTHEVCETEAKGRADALRAELEARYKRNPEAEFKAKTVTADANFAVAKAKCETLKGGGAKDRCMQEAKAAREAALRQAKVEKVQETGGYFHSATAHRHVPGRAS